MRVPDHVYFSFALPALSIFTFALTYPLKMLKDEKEMLNAKIKLIGNKLSNDKQTGIIIILIGLASSYISAFLPVGLRFFVDLFFFSSFAGLLYIKFGSLKYKNIILLLFLFFILLKSLGTGMFTIVVYMGITIFSFFLLGNSMSLLKKMGLFLLGVFGIIIIQNVKLTFRKNTWNKDYEGNKLVLFTQLMTENIRKGDVLFEKESFYHIYTRINQGYNVSLVMKRIPAVQPFDGGINLSRSLAAALIPRLLWPDKPEAGGKFNMQHYAGITLRGWSTNIGPLGEAYGSFGRYGGIFFMFLLGLLIRFVYRKVFDISDGLPLIVLWIPVLFYQVTYSAETDTLQILNTLFKTSFFIWLIYKLLPGWLGRIRTHSMRKKKTNKTYA